MPPQKFYAVAVGRRTGIFHDWPTTQSSVAGYPKAMHRSFKTESEARHYLSQHALRSTTGDVNRLPSNGISRASSAVAASGSNIAVTTVDTLASYSSLRGRRCPAESCFLLQFDGGSRGNPGPGGCGVVIYTPSSAPPAMPHVGKPNHAPTRSPVFEAYKFERGPVTNNAMEYDGLLLGLSAAVSMGVHRLLLEGDSQLVVRQLEGAYSVHAEHLRDRYAAAMELIADAPCFEYIGIRHVFRETNTRADALANEAMDSCAGVQRFHSGIVSQWGLVAPFTADNSNTNDTSGTQVLATSHVEERERLASESQHSTVFLPPSQLSAASNPRTSETNGLRGHISEEGRGTAATDVVKPSSAHVGSKRARSLDDSATSMTR